MSLLLLHQPLLVPPFIQQTPAQLFQEIERRDAAEVLDEKIRQPVEFASQRAYVRNVLRRELMLSSYGAELVNRQDEPDRTRHYRAHVNADDVPSNIAAAGYTWHPGTELAATEPRRLS